MVSLDIQSLERHLRTYRPAGMSGLTPGLVWPRYDGLSVGNLPATIAQALGAPFRGAPARDVLPPLRSDLLDGLLDGVQRVVLLVVDGLGWEQLTAVLEKHPHGGLRRMTERGRCFPITTTFLSTTTSVLSTLWSGRPSAAHGLLGFEMFLREWLMAVEAIGFSAVHESFANTLLRWGFEPEKFIPVPGFGEWLSGEGVNSVAVIQKQISNTPLSRMNFRGVQQVRAYNGASDFWLTLRQVLNEQRNNRCFISGYWGLLDTLAHHHGPQDESCEMEILTLGRMLDDILLKPLAPRDRSGVLLLLTADHGLISSPAAATILLGDHPELRDTLFLPPLGEARTPFFHVRNGQYEAAWAYLNEHFAEQFLFFPAAEVLRSGMLGPGPVYAETPYRLGDIVGLARSNAAFIRDATSRRRLHGRHGGMSAAEMLVPLLALRLDA